MRRYTIFYSGTLTQTGGDADIFELTPASNKPIHIKRILLSQTSEVGDAAEEMLRYSVIYLPATVTSGNGSAVTPSPYDPLTAAAGFTAEANGSTLATTSGTAVTLVERSWNVRVGEELSFGPDPEDMPTARNAAVLVIRNQTAPADDISITCTVEVLED